MSSEDPKDGFDLIEYPCEYAFKAMCRVKLSSDIAATEQIKRHTLEHISEESILGVS